MSDFEEEIIIKKKVLKGVNDVKEVDVKEENRYDDLMVENNGGISYIVKKYKDKSIISIFKTKYKNKIYEKGRLILVKWYKNFYGENGAYLIEMKNEKYKYLFIGGTLIYEFNLIDSDSLVKFKCNIGNERVTYAYIEGVTHTYFLSCDLKAVENKRINKDDPYRSFFDIKDNSPCRKIFKYNPKVKDEEFGDFGEHKEDDKDKEGPKGLHYFENIFKSKQEKELIDFLDKSTWKSLSDSPNSRKVQHYGYLYDYKTGKIKEKTDNIPEEFNFIIDLLKNQCKILRILPDDYEFNQLIVNNYDPGQGISAHIDTKEYGGIIGCYTIGGGTIMRFSKDKEEYDLYVEPRSLYIMSDESRYKWKHEMISRKSDVVDGEKIKRDRRISITFRFVKK